MALYTRQGFEKGSFEAYQWVLDNTEPIDIRNIDKMNVFILYKLGKDLLDVVQDAMDPVEFARGMQDCAIYVNRKRRNWWGGLAKQIQEKSPIWHRAEYMREQIFFAKLKLERERKEMIKKLKEDEATARRCEPIRARQLEWENARWRDKTPYDIDLMEEFLPNKAYPEFFDQVKNERSLETTYVTQNLLIMTFEKLHGYYITIAFDQTDLDENNTPKLVAYQWHVLCEESRRMVGEMIEKRYGSIRMKTVNRKVNNTQLNNVRKAMGISSSSFTNDINGNNLF